MNWKEILEGWRNNTFPPKKLKKEIEQTSIQRMKVCRVCKHNSIFGQTIRPDEHCMLCGCTLSAKTKCLSCDCPIKKWKAVVTEDEEELLNVNEDGRQGIVAEDPD